MPGLQQAADALAQSGLSLVTVMVDGTPEHARRVASRVGLRAPVVLGNDDLRASFRVSAYPWTILLDRGGRPVHAIRGARERDELERIFSRHLR